MSGWDGYINRRPIHIELHRRKHTTTTPTAIPSIALSSDNHVFICRYTLTGVVKWVKEVYTRGTGNDSIGTVASDGSNIYVSLGAGQH